MKERWVSIALLTLSGMVWLSGPAFAVTAAQMSLTACQRTAKVEGTKFVKAELGAIGKCLQAIASDRLQKNVAISSLTARTCVAQFRKVYDTRGLNKSLPEKLSTNIRKKCDPVLMPSLAHVANDVTGDGPGNDTQQMDSNRTTTLCGDFGVTPSSNHIQDWVKCIIASNQCQVNQAISEQYPRVSEWLTQVIPLMNAVPPPASDSTRTSDAVAGATAADTAIDANSDNIPDITCPGAASLPACIKGCCYVEQDSGFPTSCFQYSGPSSKVSTYLANCTGHSVPGLFSMTPGTLGSACATGPVHGQPCNAPTNNMVSIPQDAGCQ